MFLTGIPFFKMPSPSARALPPKNQPLFAIFQGSALLLKGMAFTARLHTLSAEAEKGHVTSEWQSSVCGPDESNVTKANRPARHLLAFVSFVLFSTCLSPMAHRCAPRAPEPPVGTLGSFSLSDVWAYHGGPRELEVNKSLCKMALCFLIAR